MRQMAFAHTTPQIVDQSKDVTRRYGWQDLQAGTQLQAVRQGQGLKKGEKAERLCVIRVVDVRRESLARLLDEPDYGREEMRREGFPGRDPEDFVAGYFTGAADVVTRIEFTYEPRTAS